MLTAEEVAFVLNDCGAAAIFTSGDKAEVIAGRPGSVRFGADLPKTSTGKVTRRELKTLDS